MWYQLVMVKDPGNLRPWSWPEAGPRAPVGAVRTPAALVGLGY